VVRLGRLEPYRDTRWSGQSFSGGLGCRRLSSVVSSRLFAIILTSRGEPRRDCSVVQTAPRGTTVPILLTYLSVQSALTARVGPLPQ
jgi:hypothetical protein